MATRSVLNAASRQKRRGRKPSARERVDEFVHTHPLGLGAATFLLGGAIGATIGATIGARIGAFNEAERRRQERTPTRTPSVTQYSSHTGPIVKTGAKPLRGKQEFQEFQATNASQLYTE